MDQIQQITESIAKIMQESGFGLLEVLEVQLAVEEACTNIIIHAYEDRAGTLRVFARVEGDRLKIMIEDDGPPFDPTEHMTLHRVTHEEMRALWAAGESGLSERSWMRSLMSVATKRTSFAW